MLTNQMTRRAKAHMRTTLGVLAPTDHAERIADSLEKIVHFVWVQNRKELLRSKRVFKSNLLRSS